MSEVVIILGAGPGTGTQLASQFVEAGYRVASVSRSKTTHLVDDTHLDIQADFSNPSTVQDVFDLVIKTWGHPSTVIYNAAQRTVLPSDDPLSGVTLPSYKTEMDVGFTSGLVAAKLAVESFANLPAQTHKTFILTGNKLPFMPRPVVLLFGAAKSAAAHMIWDLSVAYREQGYRFYFRDERRIDGRPAERGIDHVEGAKVCLELARSDKTSNWNYTHVVGVGYKDFSEIDLKEAKEW